MKLDLGSFAFGSIVSSGGGTPSWGTALGQGKGLKFTYPGWDNIMSGVLYKSVPTSKIYMPIGKGGHVYNGLEDEGIQFAALFDIVYINEVRVNAPFILVVYRDSSASWDGRRTLKYSDKIEYHDSDTHVVRNSDFISAAREALQIDEDACWIVSDMYVEDQDTLHLFAGIVDAHNTQTFASSNERKIAWLDSIKSTLADSNIYKHYCEGATICTNHFFDMNNNLSLQQIFYGAPGTGKSFHVDGKTTDENSIRTTFHPDSDYASFVGAYKPVMADTTMRVVPVVLNNGASFNQNEGTYSEKRISYKFVPQAFLKAYCNAWKNLDEPYYLVIEEINRGNCAQVFGDLFQLLDRNEQGYSSYAIEADEDIRRFISEDGEEYKLSSLQIEDVWNDEQTKLIAKGEDIANGVKLVLPKNLHIWATMNTSDQSLFPIDSAFKRRWDWEYMPIKYGNTDWMIDIAGVKYPWTKFQEVINSKIYDATDSEDKQLGDYFVKADANNIISAKLLLNKVIFYLWNDVCKDGDGDIFKINTDLDYSKELDHSKDEDITFSQFFKDTDLKLQQWMRFLGVNPK